VHLAGIFQYSINSFGEGRLAGIYLYVMRCATKLDVKFQTSGIRLNALL
jgi:hypothetical protein